MANEPCARLTKFIKPRVTDRPQASTNSSMPYATPSNRMVSMLDLTSRCRRAKLRAAAPDAPPPLQMDRRAAQAAAPRPHRLLLRGRLDRVLHVVVRGELDVVELSVLLLDLADIDVLDDVARLRIDRN